MKILVYSRFNENTILQGLGRPDYSYYFVLKDFLPVLRDLGEVVVIERAEDIQQNYKPQLSGGEKCIFLSFTPPNKCLTDLPCVTVPVFAWEFSSIPNESLSSDDHQNWLLMLNRFGVAITHSMQVVKEVKRELGSEFPIISVPSPVWDKYSKIRLRKRKPLAGGILNISSGVVVDTLDPRLATYISGDESISLAFQRLREIKIQQVPELGAAALADRLVGESLAALSWRHCRRWLGSMLKLFSARHPLAWDSKSHDQPELPLWILGNSELRLEGVVFTTLFNPHDGRKNWSDMLTAFCSAFKDEPNATLVFKLGHSEHYQSAIDDMLVWLARMPSFKCRVVLVQGYLEGSSFEQLIEASTYVINAAYGEGQCLPLMEFLSCGVPAIAPRHSAMADYIDHEVAFVVNSWEEACAWPHDQRQAYRTLRHQIDWESLKNCFLDAYSCVRNDPERYQAMSETAIKRMQAHCSREVARERLAEFLNMVKGRFAQ